ncbi:prolyl 4-hydroxylase subunit alpha-1 [Drosophila persimilis]|nr:prolyl 4-hydroxylase subunit alpha-1 [Drosophila persimilis]
MIRSTIIFFVGVLAGLDSFSNAQSREHPARSIYKLREYLELQGNLVLNLEYYVYHLEIKLHKIQEALLDMEKVHALFEEDKRAFVSNPVNSFSLIRHMHSDWMKWQLYLSGDPGQEQLAYMRETSAYLPTKDDIADALLGMERVRSVYGLEPQDMASGLLSDVQYDSSFSPHDCRSLAEYSIGMKDYPTAERWLQVAISLLQDRNEDPVVPLKIIDVTQILVESYRAQRNPWSAGHILEAALKLSPFDARLLRLKEQVSTDLMYEVPLKPRPKGVPDQDHCCNGLCKGPRNRHLHCFYLTKRGSPFLLLARVRTEILSDDPFIALYYDVLTHSDMVSLRNTSEPLLHPATTIQYFNAPQELSNSRTAHFVWLEPTITEATRRADRVLWDVTGLNLSNSEMFQVNNYGIGGSFMRHSDLLHSERNYLVRERIATAIFYLSDVPHGGATLFTELNVTVFPQAGTVLFWYNLAHSGDHDMRTRHTGCPVIVGSKWMMTRWIYDDGQAFTKPCHTKLKSPMVMA